VSEPLISPEVLESVAKSSRGERWLKLLVRKAEKAGEKDPAAAGFKELSAQLSAVLERLQARYKSTKLKALDMVVRLQRETNAFYENALSSRERTDVAQLQRLLGNLDAAFNDLEKGVGEVAAEPGAGKTTPHRPAGEPPAALPAEPLQKRYELIAKQSEFFRTWKQRLKAAKERLKGLSADDPQMRRFKAEYEQMRYERKQASRRNRGDPPQTLEEYRNLVRSRAPRYNRRIGTSRAAMGRDALSEYLGRKVTSADSFTKDGKTAKFEVPGEPGAKIKRRRPDGITLDANGELTPNPVLQENKNWRKGDDPVIKETAQTRAQRKYAHDHSGEHIVTITADEPLRPGEAPRPKPDANLAEASDRVLYVDRTTKKVTHRWSKADKRWEPL
jgi:hypothetical protein